MLATSWLRACDSLGVGECTSWRSPGALPGRSLRTARSPARSDGV